MIQFRSRNSNLPTTPTSSTPSYSSNTTNQPKSTLKSPFTEGDSEMDYNANGASDNYITNTLLSNKPKTVIKSLGLNSSPSYGRINSPNNQNNSPINCFTPSMEKGGLFNRDQCHQLARNIIQTYDSNGDGVCETLEVAKWLVDCYRAMNKTFQPTATDIASFVHIIDRDRTGKVSLDDLENFIAKFFYNPNRD